MSAQNTVVKLVNRPEGVIDERLFDTVEEPIPTPADNEILIKQTYMSLDPAMVGWMSEDKESYIPRVELGEVMRSLGFGVVETSNHPDFQPGDQVSGLFGCQRYTVRKGDEVNKLAPEISAEQALALLGLPGLTATQGLLNVGRPNAGETLVVTGAAGSVGSIVGQLGKAEGMRVLGVVGNDEKAHWLTDELGFDGAVNYKSATLADDIAKLTPDGVDLFFENTGGPVQNHVYQRMNAHGRIVVCGLIADYLSDHPTPGPNWMNIIRKRLRIEGFTMPDHFAEYPQLLAQLMPYVQNNQLQYQAHILEGLSTATMVDGIKRLLSGNKHGKLMIKL